MSALSLASASEQFWCFRITDVICLPMVIIGLRDVIGSCDTASADLTPVLRELDVRQVQDACAVELFFGFVEITHTERNLIEHLVSYKLVVKVKSFAHCVFQLFEKLFLKLSALESAVTVYREADFLCEDDIARLGLFGNFVMYCLFVFIL